MVLGVVVMMVVVMIELVEVIVMVEVMAMGVEVVVVMRFHASACMITRGLQPVGELCVPF